jgi:hypothetical protein
MDFTTSLAYPSEERGTPAVLAQSSKTSRIAIFQLVGTSNSRGPGRPYSGVLHKVHFEGVISGASPPAGYYSADEVLCHRKNHFIKMMQTRSLQSEASRSGTRRTGRAIPGSAWFTPA